MWITPSCEGYSAQFVPQLLMIYTYTLINQGLLAFDLIRSLIRFVNWRKRKCFKTSKCISSESFPVYCLLQHIRRETIGQILTDSERKPRRSSSKILPASSFLLALASPVLHKMLCGSFSESKEKNLRLNDVDIGAFVTTMDI